MASTMHPTWLKMTLKAVVRLSMKLAQFADGDGNFCRSSDSMDNRFLFINAFVQTTLVIFIFLYFPFKSAGLLPLTLRLPCDVESDIDASGTVVLDEGDVGSQDEIDGVCFAAFRCPVTYIMCMLTLQNAVEDFEINYLPSISQTRLPSMLLSSPGHSYCRT